MQVYSQSLKAFTQRLLFHALSILEKEMKMRVGRSRFLYKNCYYPIQIVCFEGKSELGYFAPDILEIGIHRSLLFNEALALDVLRHELAHYIAFIETGYTGHGEPFLKICKRYGFKPDVARATLSIEDQRFKEVSDIQRKIQKLLNLSQSANAHEAEAALLKAEALLKEHSLSSDMCETNQEQFYLERVLERSKFSAKHRAITSILRHFEVEVVFRSGTPNSFVELIGSKEGVQIASYIADHLDHKLEQIWEEIKLKNKLKGLSAKNSFFRGFAEGYGLQKRAKSKERDLIELRHAKAMALIYPKLRSTTSSFMHDPASHKLGQEKGGEFSISAGIKNRDQKFLT
jgi:hypothetical protein